MRPSRNIIKTRPGRDAGSLHWTYPRISPGGKWHLADTGCLGSAIFFWGGSSLAVVTVAGLQEPVDFYQVCSSARADIDPSRMSLCDRVSEETV